MSHQSLNCSKKQRYPHVFHNAWAGSDASSEPPLPSRLLEIRQLVRMAGGVPDQSVGSGVTVARNSTDLGVSQSSIRRSTRPAFDGNDHPLNIQAAVRRFHRKSRVLRVSDSGREAVDDDPSVAPPGRWKAPRNGPDPDCVTKSGFTRFSAIPGGVSFCYGPAG